MKYLSLGMMAVLVAAFAAGCAQEGATPPVLAATIADPGEPVTGDWLIERLPVQPPHLNPIMHGDAYVQLISAHIFQSMITRDNETLEVKPHVAECWEISEDHLTYTFHLRRDVTFSDGAPLTAHDVAFTYEAIMNPENDTAPLRSYYSNLDSVEVPDDYTVIIRCTEPYFKHLDMFGGAPILPRHIYGEGEFNTHPNNRAPVGSGPYLFHSWLSNQQIVLTRRPDHWDAEKQPYLDRLVFKMISDENAAFQVLQRGDLDRMRVTSPIQWKFETTKPNFEARFARHQLWSPADGYLGTFGWIGWNARRPLFEDKRVRQALTMLLDRQGILDSVYHGLGRVVTGATFPDGPDYDPSIEPWPYDPERAMALLEEAGWVDTTGNGIRDKDGREFTFSLLYTTGSPESDALATIYKEYLRRAGINMILRPLEWATFQLSVNNRNFDACMMAWVSPVDSDPYQIWHSSQEPAGSNYVGFVNAEADALIEEARLEFDRERRAEMYRRFHHILHEEQPYTFLYNRPRTMAVDQRFQDVVEYPQGFDIHEWWVPRELRRYGRQP